MIGGHPDCLCVHESHFKTAAVRRLSGPVSEWNAQEAWEAIRANRRYQLWDLGLRAEALPRGGEGLSYAELIEWIVGAYGRKVGEEGWLTWVDHTPDNVQHAALLFELFPSAKLIHLVRDGRAVIASVLPIDWGPNTTRDATRWWIERLAFGLAAEHKWPERVLRVRYEDLIRDPVAELGHICRFTGLTYDPSMLETTGYRPLPDFDTANALIGSGIKTARADAWRTSLSPLQIEGFEAIARDLLCYLGYTSLYGLRARSLPRSSHRRERRTAFVRKQLTKRLRRWHLAPRKP